MACSEFLWTVAIAAAAFTIATIVSTAIGKFFANDGSLSAGRQFFSRYPVLKIHHTVIMQMARNISVMPTLTPTLTSAIS